MSGRQDFFQIEKDHMEIEHPLSFSILCKSGGYPAGKLHWINKEST